jgi:hypothetical protein
LFTCEHEQHNCCTANDLGIKRSDNRCCSAQRPQQSGGAKKPFRKIDNLTPLA